MIRRFINWLSGATHVLKVAKQVNYQQPTERPKTLAVMPNRGERGVLSVRRKAA